jgi:N-acetylmuramoyl-L-alanine amidase
MPMKRSRRAYTERATRTRRRVLIAAAVAVVGASILVAAAFTFIQPQSPPPSQSGGTASAASLEVTNTAAPAASEDSATAAAVEVPDLTGRTLAEAQVLLDAMGVSVVIVEDETLPLDAVADARIVQAQDPIVGTVLSAGAVVRISVPSESGQRQSQPSTSAVVVIDPGHQSRGDSTPEPIGPGATETKPRVTGGTTGVVTRVPEYEVVLQIATNLKTRLEAQGITVVMTRTTNDVNISNSERARIANEAGADLFVRIHADGNVDSAQAGISTLYPGENRWTSPIVARSLRAANAVQGAVIASTGAVSRGVVPRTDLSGFNWATVPSVLIECGFLTNAVEDRLVSSPHYQDKLAEGIATGIRAFLTE